MRKITLIMSVFLVAAVLFIVAYFCGPAYAQDIQGNATETSRTAVIISDFIDKFVAVAIPAMLAAASTSLTGYFKANKPGSYSLVKLFYTAILSTIVALIVSFIPNMTTETGYLWVIDSGLTIPIYFVAQGITDRWGQHFLPGIFIPSTDATASPLDAFVKVTVRPADLKTGITAPFGTLPWIKDAPVNLIASPASGFAFDFWEIDGLVTTQSDTFDSVADKDRVFIAHFKKI